MLTIKFLLSTRICILFLCSKEEKNNKENNLDTFLRSFIHFRKIETFLLFKYIMPIKLFTNLNIIMFNICET